MGVLFKEKDMDAPIEPFENNCEVHLPFSCAIRLCNIPILDPGWALGGSGVSFMHATLPCTTLPFYRQPPSSPPQLDANQLQVEEGAELVEVEVEPRGTAAPMLGAPSSPACGGVAGKEVGEAEQALCAKVSLPIGWAWKLDGGRRQESHSSPGDILCSNRHSCILPLAVGGCCAGAVGQGARCMRASGPRRMDTCGATLSYAYTWSGLVTLHSALRQIQPSVEAYLRETYTCTDPNISESPFKWKKGRYYNPEQSYSGWTCTEVMTQVGGCYAGH